MVRPRAILSKRNRLQIQSFCSSAKNSQANEKLSEVAAAASDSAPAHNFIEIIAMCAHE